jgi:PDZ domain-containing secreted protein
MKIQGLTDKGLAVIGSPVENLFPFVTANANESAPWEFWDSATTVAGATAFGRNGQQILANAAIANPDMSMAKATAYMDSTLGFFLPRIYKTLFTTQPTGQSCIADFENLPLSSEAYWDGSDLSGIINYPDYFANFYSGNFSFNNIWNIQYNYWKSGWSYSNITSGFPNRYSAKAGGGFNSPNYAIGKSKSTIVYNQPGPFSAYITNNTYPANTMRDGDQFAKKFTNADQDFFKLHIYGYSNGFISDSLEFYLADFTHPDSTLDYIVDNWQYVELPYGQYDSINFNLSSSDVGAFGINTPEYFCIDNVANFSYGIDSIVSCDSYTWLDGNTYTSSNNTATYTIQNTAGCDSIVTLDLTLNYSSTSSISNLYCGSYLYNGQTYFTPNNFYDTLTNANGCDSIIVNSFTRNITYGIDTIISCNSYTWIDGNTYTSSNNSATHTIQNSSGCDSIITLNLTINSNQFNADFTVNQTLFTAPPFAAQFTNTTPNPSNYNFTWDFSDGTILQSNNPSVFHQFLNNGLYSVTLIAENILTGCADTMYKDDFIFCAGGTSCTHASTINQTGPITGCLSDSIFLTCNTDPTFSYQWRLNGTYIPGAIDTIYYPTQSGNYSVLISQNSCPEVSSDISVTVSPTPNTPFITSSGTLLPCQASSVTLSVPNNFTTYSWSSGGTASSEVISSSGSYFVSVTNSGGCASTSLPFNVNASFVQPPDVCIVGVNPQTNFNRVIWEHPNSTAIDSFYVYKETNQANIYQKIGGTAFNDTAIFDDVSSNPAVQAYRYKLSLVDSCGVESALGDFHKTIHLTINQGIGSAWNLIWSGYEGFTYPSYNIYRGLNSNNMVLLTTIASNLNSYTDLTAPAGQLYYQIEVVSSFSCDPSRSFNTSRSNIVENGVVSCNNTGTDIISSCDSITWIDGVVYTASNNTATYTLTNSAGCDSIVTLDLTINQTLSGTDVISSCDSITWIDGITYTASNNSATFTIQTANGCDSTVTLNLTINQGSTGTDVISSCDSITWIDGITYSTNNNTATFTLQTANGCDSVVTLDLAINQTLSGTDVISSCDSITWIDGITYTTSNNTANYTFSNAAGCDSIVTLNLTISSGFLSEETISACDSLLWSVNGNTYTQNGIYYDSLQSSNGCDSLYKLDLIVNSSSSSLFSTSSCLSYTWNGQTLLATGIYIDTNVNAAGCLQYDSLDLTITTIPNVFNQVACDSFAWNGTSYNTSGTYTTSGACVDTLNLTINNSSTSISSLSSCDSVNWNGLTYSVTGIYNFITTNSVGCDSTATLNLNIDSGSVSQLSITACNSYLWNGVSYNQSGTYYDSLQNTTGCDSTLVLNLTVDSSTTTTLSEVACNTYFWNNNSYTSSGNYRDTLQNVNGCDSVVTLNLTINNSSSSLINITACDSYSWNGTSYNVTGIYYDSLQTASGCDSIQTLNLTINNSINNTLNISACDTYSWNGVSYNVSGTYTYSSLTASGCDSIVTLNLTINNSYSNTDTINSCNSYSWNGTTYNQSGTYYDSSSTVNGCDSINILSLIISGNIFSLDTAAACQSYIWNGNQYDSSGIYIDTITSLVGCDSIKTLYLTINDDVTSPITLELLLDDYCLETYWNVKDSQDSVWYSGQNYNCNPSGGGTQANAIINKKMYLDPNDCYTFELGDVFGDGLGASFWGGVDGSWLIKDFNNLVIGQGQGDFGFILEYSFLVGQSFVTNVIENEALQAGISIYPNPTNENITISIENFNGNIQTEVYDLIGNRLQTTNETTISLQDYARGIYILKVAYGDRVEEIKVIKD